MIRTVCPVFSISRASRMVLVLVALLSTSSAWAQLDASELRSMRHMAVGNLSWINDATPSLQGGYLFQISIDRSHAELDDLGATQIDPPRWYAHSLVSLGWSFDEVDGDAIGFTGRGQLGLLYAFDGPLTINRVGPTAQATWGPEAYGAGLRAEFFHGNAGISVGWLSIREDRSNGFFVNIDLMRCILQDLGLVEKCVIQ